jgi:hypothetical protein
MNISFVPELGVYGRCPASTDISTVMSPLKLQKLPDRETAKITFTVSMKLRRSLEAYAELYNREYGIQEAVADLIPHMLEAFINSDRVFRQSLQKTKGHKPKPSGLSDNPTS